MAHPLKRPTPINPSRAWRDSNVICIAVTIDDHAANDRSIVCLTSRSEIAAEESKEPNLKNVDEKRKRSACVITQRGHDAWQI